MAAFKIDGTFTAAAVMGGPRYVLPFERDATALIVEQDYIILIASWARQALNTAHASVTGAILVKESDLTNVGAGLAKWTRTYAKVPATRSEYESHAYTFPALIATVLDESQREPLTLTVNSRLQYDYFLVDGSTIASPDEITILPALKFYITSWGVFYATAPPVVNALTTPTRAEYEIMIGNKDEIIAEDSILRPWMGNIYERITRYVIAQ